MSHPATDPFHDPALVNQDPGVLTVWSDIGCPWASLALQTLWQRARERDVDILVDHRAFPLELFNRRPTPKGIIDLEVAAVAGLLPSLGWRAWDAPDATYAVTMLPALAAVQAAKDSAIGGLRGSGELDAALRRAFYENGRCISIHTEILEVAETCSSVFVPALESALERGAGVGDVFAQWRVARDFPVQGSPHLFASDGYAEHNPGVSYRWTAPPEVGFLRIEECDDTWADTVLDTCVQ